MWHKLFRDRTALACILLIGFVVAAGLFADWLPLNNPNKANIAAKLKPAGAAYPLGTDALGRCTLARLVYGIRTTVLLSILTMACTLTLGVLVGLVSGYFRGIVDEVTMRVCDVMLSFPSQVMILAVVGMLGVGMTNIIIANIVVKWAWYARMIRSAVIRHADKGYVLFSRTIGTSSAFILFRHLFPAVAAEVLVLASLDTGWVILNVSTLSFLGLGVQAPTAEWGAMLNEAKSVMLKAPAQMLVPGVAISVLVAAFNLLGDSLRDAMDLRSAKEVS